MAFEIHAIAFLFQQSQRTAEGHAPIGTQLSFDHLVGPREQRLRYGEAERAAGAVGAGDHRG
jgi:hypothetical protein